MPEERKTGIEEGRLIDRWVGQKEGRIARCCSGFKGEEIVGK